MERKIRIEKINRLMKCLKAAIETENFQVATGLAKKIDSLCSIIEQQKNDRHLQEVVVNVEDSLGLKGPLLLELPLTMTIAQLKEKIINEFQIEKKVQRWVIGRELAFSSTTTLKDLKVVEKLPVFLQLTAKPTTNTLVSRIDCAGGPSTSASKCFQIDLDAEEDSASESDGNSIEIVEEGTCISLDKCISLEREIYNNKFDVIHVDMNGDEIQENNMQDLKGAVGPIVDAQNQLTEIHVKMSEDEIDENNMQDYEGAVGPIVDAQNKEYDDLTRFESWDVVVNTDAIECPICLTIYGPAEGIVLRDCLHGFCWTCLQNTIKHCEEPEIKCPYADNDYACQSYIQEREIKAIVDPQLYEKHLAKSLSLAKSKAGKDAFLCMTPDCTGWCLCDPDVWNFLCPVCDMTNCLPCRAIHHGKNCAEYQDYIQTSKDTNPDSMKTAEMIESMFVSQTAMQCPRCGVVVMKLSGCDALTCSMCKTEICWVTKGPRWGPGGRNDTSGGCRCNINGKRCHPNCRNCH